MNLISKEAVNNLEKSDTKGSDYDRGWNDALYAVDMLPSAFEGMTNGEVIQALFPYIETEDASYDELIGTNLDKSYSPLCRDWWNAPYKAESEGTE